MALRELRRRGGQMADIVSRVQVFEYNNKSSTTEKSWYYAIQHNTIPYYIAPSY